MFESFSASVVLTSRRVAQIHEDLHKAFRSGKTKSIAYRKQQLLQLCYLLQDNLERFKDAFAADLGRPAEEADLYVVG